MATKKIKKKQKHKSLSLFTRLKELLSFNIGTIIFGAIFFYMAITLFMYFTSHNISTYQVVSGPLAKNQTYTGLVVREEELITANSSGYVTYYARDNAKVKKNGVVYSIGDSKSNSVSIELTDSTLNSLRRKISAFSTNYDLKDYNDIYNFKYELEGALLQNTGLSTVSSGSGNTTLGNQTVCAAPDDGIILYSMDGYEDFDKTSITADDISRKTYQMTNLKTEKKVSAGDPVYKLITDETWSIYIPLTAKQIIQLSERTSIRVKFLKDGATQVGKFLIHSNDDGTYWGELRFSSGMIRYANDRFLDIELVTNAQTGLKIPISSIVNKKFYVIPENFASKGGNSNDIGFLLKRSDSDPDSDPVFESLTIYEHANGFYYVDTEDVSDGDVITLPESQNRYVIGKTDTLEGVYCINKGYAVFRKIIIVDKNDEYCIVETGTPYGLAQFDHIVLDSSTVNEQQILY